MIITTIINSYVIRVVTTTWFEWYLFILVTTYTIVTIFVSYCIMLFVYVGSHDNSLYLSCMVIYKELGGLSCYDRYLHLPYLINTLDIYVENIRYAIPLTHGHRIAWYMCALYIWVLIIYSLLHYHTISTLSNISHLMLFTIYWLCRNPFQGFLHHSKLEL